MQTPKEFYSCQKDIYSDKLLTIKKKLSLLSIVRLIVFLGTIAGVYFSIGIPKLPFIIGVIGIALFLFLVSRYTDTQYEKNRIQELININKAELLALEGNFNAFEAGLEFSNPAHAFSHDIDLFGKGSFFQCINRTATDAGKNTLAHLLSVNDISSIEQKQEAIKELQQMPEWLQDFRATGSLVRTDTKVTTTLRWLKDFRSFTPKFVKPLVIGFSILSLLVFVLVGFSLVPESVVVVWLIIGFGVLSPYLKRVADLSQNTSKVQEIFQQYHKLLMQIETTEFSSELLKEKYQFIHSETKKASQIVHAFSKALDALDQRNNIFFSIPANGFFLWDLWQVNRIEKWIHTYRDHVEKWFEVITFFDAQISLANFAFNHQHYTYPKITTDHTTIIKDLGHPLVDEKKLVKNDLHIENGQFFVITGANMAGKSTFLRTVSLHHVMANTGLPVCASNSLYSPIKLITSMRTSDSLSDDESYFFSELKRLKYVIDHIEQETYFIVLDEILKGTNSKDKAEGSKKFLEKLSNSKSTGIIATHDLSLCKVAEKYPMVKNYYFDAYIKNDQLSFDYKFKEGICQNMNASFLLQKMGIV